jgi:2-iminoacetate synthase ThiH
MNSLFQSISPQMPQQVNNLAQMVKNSANPAQLFQNMAKTNPQVQSIMQTIQQTNMTPKQLFYQTAQQRGVDPNQVLGMFR